MFLNLLVEQLAVNTNRRGRFGSKDYCRFAFLAVSWKTVLSLLVVVVTFH